ncbi:MAG: ATP-binding protein [Planctomycetota bacterium]
MSRLRGGLSALLAGALLLSGCGASSEAVANRREALRTEAEAVISSDLASVVACLFEARDGAEEALASAEGDAERRFEALEALRQRAGVDGVQWEGPGGESAWAGRSVDGVAFPPPPPWQGSFESGGLTYHEGPFVRALLLEPVPSAGGYFTATVLLDEQWPGDLAPPFGERWVLPLGIERVEIRPLSEDGAPEGGAPLVVESPSGEALFAVEVWVPGEAAVGDRMRHDARARAGVGLLILWVLLLVGALRLNHRWAPARPVRWLVAGLVVLVFRTALGWVDLPLRFRFLRPAFDPAEFGIDDPLGWLGSPADFALTAVAFLLVAAGFAAAAREARRPSGGLYRIVAFAGGLGCAAAISALWIGVIDLAVAQGQTGFFEAPSFVPPPADALMLTGLVAATAAAWLLCVAALRVAKLPWPGGGWVPAGVAVAAAALALLLAGRTSLAWAPLLLPAASLPFLRGSREEPGMALPSRMLLTSVLAIALLFPLLWNRVGERRASALATAVEELLRAEATAQGAARLDLEAASRDAHVRRALEDARTGPVPEGIALHVWLHSFLAQPGESGVVSILDARGRLLDHFTLTPLPARWIPAPAPPAGDAPDVVVETARNPGRGIRSLVGRARVRGEGDTVLGSVVFTVPDRTDLAVRGLGYVSDAAGGLVDVGRVGAYPLEYAIMRRGRVEASSSPTVSRLEGGFGPPALAELGLDRPELSWRTTDMEGHASWSEDRGVVVGVRRRTAGFPDAVLAMARLVVVGVGLGLLAALAAALTGLRGFKSRLQHRILLSYFVISFIPIIILGWASAREVRGRHDAYLAARLETDVGRARTDLEVMDAAELFERADDANLVRWAHQRRHEILLYRSGTVTASSRTGLVEAELLASRLPPEAYLATVSQKRELVRREATFAGVPAWFGYAPVLDGEGRPLATMAIPLLYDRIRVEGQLAMTGSVLLAAYLLTLVLVLVGGIVAARRLTRPLGLLAAGTRRVAAGELDLELPPAGSDELGDLVAAFNTMTRDLRAATARAVRAERETAWRQMARQVAHEIKNPLTPMRLMIQQMEADIARDPDQAVEAIRRTAAVVLRQIEALGRIAGDFASFARLPRRTLTEVDVATLVEHVVELYSGSAAEGVEVTSEIDGEIPRVRWDQEELRRVLVNLVGNAVQAIRHRGTVTIRVRAASRRGRPGVAVDVADTGVGIPEGDRDRLFEPDFSTKTAGTGLGLAIVRRTLDDMGGEIDVESSPEEGSCFRVWWPVAPEAP